MVGRGETAAEQRLLDAFIELSGKLDTMIDLLRQAAVKPVVMSQSATASGGEAPKPKAAVPAPQGRR